MKRLHFAFLLFCSSNCYAQKNAIYTGVAPDKSIAVLTIISYESKFVLVTLDIAGSNNAVMPIFFMEKDKLLGSDAYKFTSEQTPNPDMMYLMFPNANTVRLIGKNGMTIEFTHNYRPYVRNGPPCNCMSPEQAYATIRTSLDTMDKARLPK